MITDFHTHIFPESLAPKAMKILGRASHTIPYTDGTKAGLLKSMREAGVGRSVVLPVATHASQVEMLNDAYMRESKNEGLVYFGAMHPDYDDCGKELKRLADAGFKGIKIHPPQQGVDADDIRFLRIMYAAAENGLYTLLHTGNDIGFPEARHSEPDMLARAVKAVGGDYLILGHMGAWGRWEEGAELLAGTGVYIDTSYSLGKIRPDDSGYYSEEDLQMLTEEEFVRIVRAYGANRVLFGTDSPWTEQKKSVQDIMALPLTEKEKALILSENAERILGL